ncbi:MAG: signal peptidase II [Planctomycetota bacterium]|nr:signal peptidase II [Planctomycetota bacterium]
MTEAKTDDSGARPSPGRFAFRHLATLLPDRATHLMFWALTCGGVVLDLWSKKTAFDRLSPHEIYPVIDGFLQLVKAENNGAAFGLFAGKAYFLTAVSCIATVVILGVFLFGGNRQKLVNIALGLFAAGVCGNLYDRAFNNGLVRDFIDVYYRSYHWHTFNIADALLCVGVGLLMISTFFIEQPAQKHDRQHE